MCEPPARRAMVVVGIIVLLLLAPVLPTGCASPPGDRAERAWPPSAAEPMTSVWLVRHALHTRVALRTSDVDPAEWPESRELGMVAYVEVGWGDRAYYPKPDPSVWDGISAVLRPTPAALHVGGLDRSPEDLFPDQPVIRIPVSARGVTALSRFIHVHYARDAAGAPVRIAPGYYARSWFYEATGRYHAFYNSNTWSAEALRAAGVPVEPGGVITAGQVVARARRFGADATAR